MELAIGIVLTVSMAIGAVVMLVAFVWAARKDGEEERARREKRLDP
jgi:hypothetical protein